MADDELVADVERFADEFLPSVNFDALLRAARVAKDIRVYDEVARSNDPYRFRNLPVELTPEEKRALRREKDVPFSEKGMRIVILTVSLAALLQGEQLLFTLKVLLFWSCGALIHEFARFRAIILQWRDVV